MPKGSLVIVGTGIQLIRHTTIEARMFIKQADKVLFLVVDRVTEKWIKSLNKNSENLFDCYVEGKPRNHAYNRMVQRTLKYVRQGLSVCVVYYGHPGIFDNPSHESIKLARKEGYYARMMPGISAEDCLFADLGVDPGNYGCQSFEATDFLIRRRKFDSSSSLVLWQIGVIGEFTFKRNGYTNDGIGILTEVLEKYYEGDHQVIIYEASQYPIFDPSIQKMPLRNLPLGIITPISTLFVPPRETSTLDSRMLNRLKVAARQNKNPVRRLTRLK